MISNDKAKGAVKLQSQKNKELQQKEETLQNVLNTLKTNPKFIKLLVYSLNSLESFVSPPNKDIRVNAKIILRLEGVGVLKMVSTINLTNEDIVEQTGTIIWKIITVNDFIDYECAKLFADTHGHEAVIEILLSKDKGKGSKPLIKVLNGLVQVPQLVQKLIESGLIETVKLVNDIYVDDQDIITLNFDTMKKISNLKAGREILIKKNLVPNLLKNIKLSAIQKDPVAVISGFNIVDNISRSDNGKEALKKSNAIESISQILDHFENDDRVLKMGAKIYSKISKPEDVIKEIEKLDAIYFKQDYNDLKELEKSLVLISNFMLVDDICRILCEPNNLTLLINLFNDICKIDLTDKSSDYIKTYVLLNKYFMIVFNRINNNLPTLFEGNEQLYDNINNSIIKNWESIKTIAPPQTTKSSSDEEKEAQFIKVLKEFFSSYVDLIDKHVAHKGLGVVNINVLKYILRMLLEFQKHLELDEKSNFAASRVLKIANKIPNDEEIRILLEKLFPYMKGVINTSDFPKTLSNDLEVIFGVLTNSPTTFSEAFNLSSENATPTMKEQILPVLINFMNTKPKFRAANLQNLQILDLIMSVPNFMDIYFRVLQKNHNLINPIISVMAKHLYETSTVLKVLSTSEHNDKAQADDSLPDEKTENEINTLGAKLLEKLVDVTEFKKMIKSFKDLVSSYNPGNANMETITNLEFHLLYFFAILKIKSYFTNGLSEILDTLKQLLKKEITYIEAFKKDKNNEKNEKYLEIVNSSSKRLNLEIAILKLINENCNNNYEETRNEAYIPPLKEVISTILEIFDKSSDSSNLIDLLGHLQKNLQFLLEHESDLNTTEQTNKTSVFMHKNTVKFEDSIVEKITNILMNLLRKSPDDENLAESIITTFINLTNKKPETCNFLVKAGCPRLLLQLIENTSNKKLAKLALNLIKIISLSSEENLKMVSNQNILEKLHEIHTKFASEEEITSVADTITNELIKLPGQEHIVNDIIQSNISEFHKNMKENAMESPTGKPLILSNLEKINAFSSNKKQIQVLNSDVFLGDLTDSIGTSIKDSEVTDLNEKLLQNQIVLLKKINEEVKTVIPKEDNKIAAILDAVLNLMKEKSNYRDVYLNAAKILSDYISDDEVFNTHLKDKLDFDFVDSLFETAENYIDDIEVSKEINNILCNLCLRSEKLAGYIVQKGGLANVMEELKSIVSLNDEPSRNLKLNGLKFLQALVKDDANMEKFLKANGAELINNLLKNELNLISGDIKDYANNINLYFMTDDTFNITIDDSSNKSSSKKDNDGNTNPHTVYCFKIINENNKKNLGSFNDPKLFKNVLLLLEGNYPNKQLFLKGMKLVSRAIEHGAELDVEDKRLMNQVVLSNLAYYLNDAQVNDFSKKILENDKLLYLFDENYLNILKQELNLGAGITDSENPNPVNYSEVLRTLTFSTLYAELDVNKSNLVDNFNDNLFEYYKQVVNFYSISSNLVNKQYSCNDGVALALMKLTNYFAKIKKIDNKTFEELSIDSKLSTIALNYYKPANYNYVNEFLKLFKNIFETVGNKDEQGRLTEDYIKYLQDVYLTSFGFFEHYGSCLENGVPEKVEDNFNQIIENIIAYYKIDQDADIKVSSIKSLAGACLTLISNEKLNSDNKSYPRIRSLWEILYHVTRKDINNIICTNDEVVAEILDKLAQAIEKTPEDALLRDLYKLITSKLDNNPELFEKIMDFLAKDIRDHGNQENALAGDVECLYNLSKFPIISKILLKNNYNILDALKTAYKQSEDKPTLRYMLSGILKNLLGNNLNTEIAIEQHPEFVSILVDKINNHKPDLSTEMGQETAKNEVDSLLSLLNDNYKLLVQDKQLIDEGVLPKTAQVYADDKELSDKIQELLNKISEMNHAKLAEESLNKDRDTCKNLCDYVKEQFDQHMNELQSLKSDGDNKSNALRSDGTLVRGSTRILTTNSALNNISSAPKAKMSVISKTLFFNTDNIKIKSPLSCKDNCDIPQTIDQILNLLRKLYNENRNEKDMTVFEEKNKMMFNLLQALKALSISPDNHKVILEMGLMNFLEKLLVDPAKPAPLYIETLDIIKNCTFTEGSIPVFLESSAAEPVVQEVISLYDKPDLITHNKEVRQVFFHSNMIFSNLCRSKKGFNYLFTKIGMDKLLDLGKKTSHIDILTAIIEMLINYLQNHSRSEINPLIKDIISILTKSLGLKEKTPKLLSGSLILSGLIYAPDILDQMVKLNLVNAMTSDFDKFSSEPEFLNAVLFCLGKITINNVLYSRDVIDTGLLEKLKEITTKGHINNEIIIENITSLYKNLVLNNLENIEKFCKGGIVINVFFCLESYWDKGASESGGNVTGPLQTQSRALKEENQIVNIPVATQIVINCVACLDSLTISDKAIAYLADTKFSSLILDTLNKKQNEIEIIKTALHCLGSYLYKEIGNNLKTFDFEKLIKILIFLQKKHYSNSDILININYIAGYLIQIIKDKSAKEKLYMIISSTLKIQDWNVALIIMTLKLMLDILTVNPQLIDEVFDDNMQCLFNLLKLYKENAEIQMYCYKILSLFGKNYIYSYTMVNAGLIDFIKQTLDSEAANDLKTKNLIREVILNLLIVLSSDPNNAKKISDVLMGKLIKDLREEDFNNDMAIVVKLLFALSKHKNCIEPLIQYKGLDGLLKILRENPTNVDLVFDGFSILSNIAADGNDEYKRMMITMRVVDLVNEIITKSAYLDKKIEFEGRSLIFAINNVNMKLDEIGDLNYVDIKVENPIKTEVRNFLVNGKIIKM